MEHRNGKPLTILSCIGKHAIPFVLGCVQFWCDDCGAHDATATLPRSHNSLFSIVHYLSMLMITDRPEVGGCGCWCARCTQTLTSTHCRSVCCFRFRVSSLLSHRLCFRRVFFSVCLVKGWWPSDMAELASDCMFHSPRDRPTMKLVNQVPFRFTSPIANRNRSFCFLCVCLQKLHRYHTRLASAQQLSAVYFPFQVTVVLHLSGNLCVSYSVRSMFCVFIRLPSLR